ncbi:hypothetical protein E6W17_36740 [Streptomyces sp. A1547]|nr:hypothetical protein E6W17_36740 [Streptomyces sp. A1547]
MTTHRQGGVISRDSARRRLPDVCPGHRVRVDAGMVRRAFGPGSSLDFLRRADLHPDDVRMLCISANTCPASGRGPDPRRVVVTPVGWRLHQARRRTPPDHRPRVGSVPAASRRTAGVRGDGSGRFPSS